MGRQVTSHSHRRQDASGPDGARWLAQVTRATGTRASCRARGEDLRGSRGPPREPCQEDVPGRPVVPADFTHTALYDELAARTGVRVDGGREHIRGVVPTAAGQRVPGTPRSTGTLLGFAAGRPEWRRTLIRGDRSSLLAEFSARTGYRLAPDERYPVRGTPDGLAPGTRQHIPPGVFALAPPQRLQLRLFRYPYRYIELAERRKESAA